MQENKIPIRKTARYFTHGEDITSARRIWFALHGYGQLANYFIRSFAHLDPKTNFVIAPEGMNRFYLDGLSGRVGATWMTKEARLDDIADYVGYLDQLYQHLDINSSAEIIALGFSQGVATVSRWISQTQIARFDQTILWAGSFPEGLEPEKAIRSLSAIKVHCVIGDDDPFINEKVKENQVTHLKNLGLNPNWHSYKGDHRIPKDALNQLIEKL